jgi:hypothetical protein
VSDPLAPIPDLDALVQTRLAWHSVAEHVLAAARYAAEQRIGLVVTEGGFAAPRTPDGGSARVDGADLVVCRAGSERAVPLTTLASAASALGIAPGSPPVFTPTTELRADAPLDVDLDAAVVLGAWFGFTWSILGELGGPTLWPEHFDAALDLGDEAAGTRGTFGASPGDAAHPEPYLYVTHWADNGGDEYWNDTAFPGASLTYRALTEAVDPRGAAHDFYARGRTALSRS